MNIDELCGIKREIDIVKLQKGASVIGIMLNIYLNIDTQ